MKTAVVFFLSVLLAGCGKINSKRTDGYTTVTIGNPAPSYASLSEEIGIPKAGPTQAGGVMVYAVEETNKYIETAFLATETASASLSLPNGNYFFYAIGYENTELQGPGINVRCGASNGGNSQSLNGTALNIVITLSEAAGCDDYGSVFALSSHLTASGKLQQTKLHACSTLPTSYQTTCTATSIPTHSWKVVLRGFKYQEGGAKTSTTGIHSGCISQGTSGGPAGSTVTVPFGLGAAVQSPFEVEVRYYTQAGCGGTPNTYYFSSGIGSANLPGGTAVFTAASAYTHIYFDVN